MPDRLWDAIAELSHALSGQIGNLLKEPLKVVGHKPLSDGGLPEAMRHTRYARVLREADDEVLLQGVAKDAAVGAFLLRVLLKNAPELGPVLPLRYDLGGRLAGAVAGVARLVTDKDGKRWYVPIKGDEQTRVDVYQRLAYYRKGAVPHALCDALNEDVDTRRMMAELPLSTQWEAHNLALMVPHGGELVCRKDHTLAQVSWVPALAAGLSTFDLDHHLHTAFVLLSFIAAMLPSVAQTAPPTSRPTGELDFFKDVDKLSALGLPGHASQAREVLDHFVELLRQEGADDTVRPLLSSTSPLRNEGELAKLREMLRSRLGTDAYRVSSVDWRYSGLKQASAVLRTPAGPWRVVMAKGPKHWEVHGVLTDD